MCPLFAHFVHTNTSQPMARREEEAQRDVLAGLRGWMAAGTAEGVVWLLISLIRIYQTH